MMAEVAISGVVIGGVIAMVSSIVSTFAFDAYKSYRDARSLAKSFKGGIGALLSIIEERKYVEFIDLTISHTKPGEDFNMPMLRAKRNYIELYNKNVDRIGSLTPSLSEKIPTFYTYLNSLLEDLDGMAEGLHNAYPAAEKLRLLVEFRDLLGKTIDLGKEIVDEVNRYYSGPLLRLPG
ncbi:hypothetical protein [Burkholderia gladioli]|uniref:hypothetical protein n=1 Tax=Burkholderia gladioli TaxID=28095 RepID=UPI00163F6843|nr:hypothetical protein [Burkholderia gladioli]